MTIDDASAGRKSSAFVPHDLKAPLRGKAVGPLAGLTAAVKDMFDIEGECAGGGSPEWLATHSPATTTCTTIKRLLNAGATIVGKTVADEFFFSVTGANSRYGFPVNPRAKGRLPGGSSSGSAAATAAGACDFALGSDTGGSVRVPSAMCGLYGIRTTHGRVPMDGVMGMAPSFDVVGWFAAGPGLMRKLASVLLDGPEVSAPIRKMLIAADCFAGVDAAVAEGLRGFLRKVAPLLAGTEEMVVWPDGNAAWLDCFRTVQSYEAWQIYGAWVKEQNPDLGHGVKARLAYAATVTDEAEAAGRVAMADIRAQIRAMIPPGTVLCLPTIPAIAPVVEASYEELERFRARVMNLTCIAGLGGLPQVNLPVATLDGCPIGLSFVGWPGADETLLDLAMTLGPYCGA